MTLLYGRELQEGKTARGLEYLMAGEHTYCSASVGGNTRKYHGLLVHRGRVYLSALDEQVNGVRISAQQYQGAQGDAQLPHLFSFTLYPPCWTCMVGDVLIRKTITFSQGVTITYAVTGEASLTIRPLITDRPVDQVMRDPRPDFETDAGGVRWREVVLEGDLPFTQDPVTYWNVWYEREQERGYDPVEDLFSPGFFTGTVRDGSVSLRCFLSNQVPGKTTALPSPTSPREWLDYAAETFCHHDEISAGYHWFRESWGRDSAISITGLLIERDRKETTQAVLRRLAQKIDGGVIPNRFPDNYHSSDASLWFIYALGRYRRHWGDDRFIAGMRPVVAEILEQYPGSGVATLDHDLIRVVPGSTWMDTVFTPREGKPVEINALWIHALDEAESMGIIPPVSVESATEAFRAFWNEEAHCLYDRIDPVDPSIRPNQVIALALGLVEQAQATLALETVARELLTPYGLRTLSPRDQAYRGRFDGDTSYHNGCVWPWLTGGYVEALLRNGRDRAAIAPLLLPILSHIREAGAGYISEIFDGDLPFLPRGCIAQAWSVAEISRACRMVFP
ncbi:amylo-alpha-1,6-glucosidase [Methanoregula sp.]|jgi:glycogen debranching enzyme|uniref:amylo-alpha-1,6-glucosidase n=1 Tax=Methanoregula sp. TaxID=2052170 RepID=UPI003C28518D